MTTISTPDLNKYAPKGGCVLCLKSLPANLMAAHNNFQWPESGICEAPDWDAAPKCGNGLHAFLWGEGDVDLRCKDVDAKWLVMSVESDSIVSLSDKVKFPKCEVVFCGDQKTAVQIVQQFAPIGTKVMFGTATAGDRGTATAGDSGTATAGLYGVIVIEYRDFEKELWLKKCAFVDGITILPGVKYRLNGENEFEAVNETEA